MRELGLRAIASLCEQAYDKADAVLLDSYGAWNLEERLLLRCCQTGKQGGRPLLRSDIPSEIDWQTFLLLARKEGIAPLLYRRLVCCLDRECIPDWLARELKREYYAVLAKNAVVFEELKKALAALNNAGVEAMVLKGAVLAEQVYGDLGVRPMADVDLLIKGHDLAAIDQAFQTLGYLSDDLRSIDLTSIPINYLTSVVYYSPTVYYLCFHLHWHIVNSTIPNDSLIRSFKITDIWNAARQTTIAGTKTLVMAPHNLLIHLAEHGLRVTHSLSQFIFLCDIHETVTTYEKEIDWDELVETSQKIKLDRFVYLSLALAVKLLDSQIPEKVLARLHPKKLRLAESLFLYLVAHNFRPGGLSYLLYFSNNRGLLNKGNFLFRTLFPPRQVIAQRSAIPLEKIGNNLYLKRAEEVFTTGFGMLSKLFRV